MRGGCAQHTPHQLPLPLPLQTSEVGCVKAERQEATALVCVRCHVLPLSLSLYGSRAPSTAHTHSWRTTRRRPHRARCVVGSHMSAGWVCTAHTSPAPSPSPTPDLRGWLCVALSRPPSLPHHCPLPLPLWFPRRSIHRTHTQLEDDTAEAPQSTVCSGGSTAPKVQGSCLRMCVLCCGLLLLP